MLFADDKNAIPGIGIGALEIGTSLEAILAVIDEPGGWERWMGGNVEDSLHFPGLCLHFDATDGSKPAPGSKLEMIRVYNRTDVTTFGQPMRTWERDKLLRTIKAAGYAVIESSTHRDFEIPDPQYMGFGFDDKGYLDFITIW